MKIIVSVSGGRTSGLMAWKMKQEWSGIHDLRFVFANTSKEREETLVMVDRMDKAWSLDIAWIEAVIHEGRIGATHRVVDFASAKRKGEVFESMLPKYGLPNMNYLHCTRELKANPLRSFARSLGWEEGEFVHSIGIRIDEPKRLVNMHKHSDRIYPLATN